MKTQEETRKRAANRWVWLCPALMILAAAGILMAWGLSWWTAMLAALMLVCPALLVWGAIRLRRKRGENGRP